MIKTLAGEASKQWTATFNPRPLTVEDFAALYESAFERRK
jgi:alcohol dehydrogenase class IV